MTKMVQNHIAFWEKSFVFLFAIFDNNLWLVNDIVENQNADVQMEFGLEGWKCDAVLGLIHVGSRLLNWIR